MKLSAPTALLVMMMLLRGCNGHGIMLRWIASPTPSVSYRVYRAQGQQAFAVIGGATATQYLDSTVSRGAVYSYKVTAMLGANESGPSNVVTIAVP